MEASKIELENVLDDDFGPVERPAQAWKRAVLSFTLLLDFLIIAAMSAIPEFALPQHTRPIPVQSVNGTWVRFWMLDNPYGADTVSSTALMLIATLVPLGAAIALSFASPARGAVKAWLHSYLWMMGTHIMIVGCIKAYCGYWRPYFLNECAFNEARGECTADDYTASAHFRAATPQLCGPLAATSLRLYGRLAPRPIDPACRPGTRRVGWTSRCSACCQPLSPCSCSLSCMTMHTTLRMLSAGRS